MSPRSEPPSVRGIQIPAGSTGSTAGWVVCPHRKSSPVRSTMPISILVHKLKALMRLGTVVTSTNRLCIEMPQTPRIEVDRPRPAESSVHPTTQFVVGLVVCRSYSYPARNAILKRPYICKFICTMETRPTLPFDFLNMQSLVAHAHMLWTKSGTIWMDHCTMNSGTLVAWTSKSLALDKKVMPGQSNPWYFVRPVYIRFHMAKAH